MNTETISPILTPDQRLRVFVSSTLNELAEERVAVKNAIQNMHLTPVMFELGARPHAPRDLYRQYLAQSQIFVGIYWDSYGWVAPDEKVSGLEDEYNLSGEMPKLIYIKQESNHREDRLTQLLNRIQNDDKVSYKIFNTPDELGNLIVNDLALLLTERFNLTLHNKISQTDKSFHSIPSVPGSLIGREKDLQEIVRIMKNSANRLLTLTGPGGIGKTRLSIESARLLQESYPDGAAFVNLAPVRDYTLVAETICYALGIKVSGGNVLDSLKLFLQDKKFLLVLDNFEQIIQAAYIIDDLLAAAPGLKIIVTSRERIALSFEHVYVVPVLSNGCDDPEFQERNNYPAAFELFVERAKAIKPSFEVTPQNKEIICKICQRVEGLPLAIELAAGQINLFTPAILLQKLEKSLYVLKGNFRDIPDRQKTIHNTVEWSFSLLSEAERKLLLQISLYPSGCLLSAVESMEIEEGQDIYALLGSLVDKSLLTKQEEEAEVRFQMLESVREFCKDKLKSLGLLEMFLQRQAEYYHHALQGIKLPKNNINQTQLLKYLETEQANIRQVLDFLMEKKDLKRIADIAWNLWLFWWVNAHTKEGYTWLKKAWEFFKENSAELDSYTEAILTCSVGTMSFLQRDLVTFNESIVKNLNVLLNHEDDELVATTALITGVVKTILKEYREADKLLDIALDRFQKIGLTTGTSIALSALGRNAVYDGSRTAEAKDYYKESMALAKQDHNEISVIIALSGFALCEVFEKNSDAKSYLRESILLSQSLHFYEALAWAIEIWSLVSINENKPLHAITLMGAVDHLRTVAQLPVWDDLNAVIIDARKQIQQQMDPVAFRKAWNEGAAMSLDKMVAFAMGR